MNRRQYLKWLGGLSAVVVQIAPIRAAFGKESIPMKLNKTKAEWAALLPAAAYKVLFEDGTEYAGSSPLNHEKRDGTFICAACFLPLFDSKTKYESGTGWPSFWQPLPDAVGTKTDFKLLYPRTEYHCARCGGQASPCRQQAHGRCRRNGKVEHTSCHPENSERPRLYRQRSLAFG